MKRKFSGGDFTKVYVKIKINWFIIIRKILLQLLMKFPLSDILLTKLNKKIFLNIFKFTASYTFSIFRDGKISHFGTEKSRDIP
jgi:hypothetical protein